MSSTLASTATRKNAHIVINFVLATDFGLISARFHDYASFMGARHYVERVLASTSSEDGVPAEAASSHMAPTWRINDPEYALPASVC